MGYLLALVMILAASVADAKTLYVDGVAGNDATNYATNDAAHPWKTIGRAAWGSTSRSSPNASEAAAAGDTVLISAGTYTTAGYTSNDSSARFQIALGTANAGAVGNPITFRGVGTVEIRSAGSGNFGPLIGSNGKNYIVWDNVFTNDYYGASVPDTGPVVFYTCTGCQLINSEIYGHNGSYASGALFQQSGSVYASGTTVTGVSGSSFVLQLAAGDQVAAGTGNYYSGETKYTVSSIASASSMTLGSSPSGWNDLLTGTVSSSGTTVTGVGTAFTTELAVGVRIVGTSGSHYAGETTYTVASIASDTSLTLSSAPASPWVGLNLVRKLSIFGPRYSQNYNAVRLEACTSCLIKNNYFYRVWGYGTAADSGDHNDAGVMTYRDVGSTIEHNECYDLGVCVIIKGVSTAESDQHDTVIRYNYAHSTTWCYRVMLGQDVHIYQNLCISPKQWGIAFGYDGSSIPTAATRARIVNNTIYNQRTANYAGFFPEGVKMVGVIVQNNIVHTAYAMYGTLVNADPSLQDFSGNYNFFYNPITAHARLNTDGGASNMTFATWQGSPYLKDTTSNNGTDPLFSNAGGSYALATDFKLQAGSTARNFGVDLLDLNANGSTVDAINAGAYITGSETIGIETGASSPTIFNPTINLRRAEIDVLRDDLTAFQTEQAARWTRVCAVLGRTRTTWAANMRREIPC